MRKLRLIILLNPLILYRKTHVLDETLHHTNSGIPSIQKLSCYSCVWFRVAFSSYWMLKI